MKATILTFNLNESRLAKLRFLCMKLGVAVQPVPPEDFFQPVGALCGLAARIESAPAKGFDAEMLVFCRMDNALVSRFLTTCRQMRWAAPGLKAVLTPTNAAWTAAQLQAELARERQAVLRGEEAAHED